MPIEVELPDGTIAEFPDGTSSETIKGALAKRFKPPAPERPKRGVVASALEGAGQGLSFGFSDEIEGAGRAAIAKLTGDQRPFGDLYSESVKIPRQRQKEAAEDSPVSYYGGEIASGLAVPGGLARLGVRSAVAGAAGRGLGARTLAGAREGAAYGAAYGLGKGEDTLGDRVNSAAGGALMGGALGGALPAAVDVASAVGSRIATPFRAAANPERFAAEKLREAIARDFPEGGAMRFADKFDDMANANPSARLMDAGGENVRGLMRAANNMPNAEREGVRRMVDARQANQHARLTDDVSAAFGEGRNFYQTIDDLTRQMDEIGANAIRPALARETPMTDALRSVLSRPTAQQLQQSVQRKLADEGLPIGFETRTAMLHRLKVELDDAIGMSRRAEQMGNTPQAGMDTRTLTILKRDLLNAIDNPEYKAGLRQYANEARLRNAGEEGFEAFNKSAPEEIKAALRNMDSDPERRMYRLGAMRAIVDKIRAGNANRDRTDGVFSSPDMQMKLRAILPDRAAYREFQKQLVIEAKMADSRKALQGNSTTAKQLAEGDQAGKNATLITSLMNAAGGSMQSGLNLLAQGYNRFTGMTPRVAAETMRQGASRDPAAVNRLLMQSIEEAAQTPRDRALLARALLGGGTAPLDVTIWPAGDPRNAQ